MTYTKSGSGALQYQQNKKLSLKGEIESASSHRLIQMLMEGCLTKIATAKTCMANNHVAGKGENVSMAISIINGLRASLDHEKGGEISKNLNDLYDYMERRLLEANLKSDLTMLDEVASLIFEIKSAWDAISPEAETKQAV